MGESGGRWVRDGIHSLSGHSFLILPYASSLSGSSVSPGIDGREMKEEEQERVRKENGVSGKEMSLTHPFPSCHSHHLFSFGHFVHGN